MAQLTTPMPPAEEWKNDGNGLRLTSYEEALGLTRVSTETYVVGGYTYTNLADAVAQGRRMQRAGAKK